ncbi:ATP-binding cassette domain-containing protein [Sporolactobacillus shoreae]|uniref:ATP-binding cassette domain-containing protein n=1 Tax=Sporolactobacillus shoreae TaxID=1465501 RepID=A0A4Z0GIR9_9BACL|nr:ATP-binding cassette domain-containing protein [Sporolactobacillus shoreae]TGA96136.1 ATP-binding cassette domain-containing protein [Sporolactobacillus shoreae]
MNIELENVSFGYTKHTTLLKNISIRIKQGEMIAIAGKSGAGKTTLTKILKGFNLPTSGKLLLDGVLPVKKNRKRFNEIGYVFQYPEHQLFSVTVFKDISFGLEQYHYPEVKKKERISEAMHSVGLDFERFVSKSPLELSGGEKRRVAIAGVIVNSPSVIILDEPSAGLDSDARDQLFHLLHRLNVEKRTTIIWVSHYPDEIIQYASRLLVIDRGSILSDGNPLDLLAKKVLTDAFGWSEVPVIKTYQFIKEKYSVKIKEPWNLQMVSRILTRELKNNKCLGKT